MVLKINPRAQQFIGLTGNLCTGKSYILKILSKNGFKTFSIDKFVRDLVSNDNIVRNLLIQHFGELFKSNDRSLFAKVIFNDTKSKAILESIIYPYTLKKIKELYNQAKRNKSIVVELPLLFENYREDFFDFIILVHSHKKSMMKRAMLSRKMELDLFEKILSKQFRYDIVCSKANCLILNENRLSVMHALKKILVR